MNEIDLKDEVEIENFYQNLLNEYKLFSCKNDEKVFEFLNSLNKQERHALVISKIMLQSSFSVEKSIGFINYNKIN